MLETHLREKLNLENRTNLETRKLVASQILQFQIDYQVQIPEELSSLFYALGNSKINYNDKLFQVYSISEFKRITDDLVYFTGIPNYSNIVNTLEDCDSCFVFADYMFHMFAYAVRLYKDVPKRYEIYVIAGDKFRVIANFFTEFVDLYAEDSFELQL